MNRSMPTGARCGHSRLFVIFLLLVAFASLALVPQTGMAACHTLSPSMMEFGNVTGAGANTSSDVQFTCANDTGETITHLVCLYVNPNTDSPTTLDPRQMKQDWPVSYIAYNLYADPARTQLLGSTSSGHTVYGIPVPVAPGSPVNGRMTIYGNIPPQTVTAGHYISKNTMFMRSPWSPGTTAPDPTACSTAPNTGQNYYTVNATNADTCYLSTATDMNFGSVADLAGNRDQTSTISLQCPPNTSYKVALDYGKNSGGTTSRRMLGPGNRTLDYELYRDSGHTQPWGNTPSVDIHDGVAGSTVHTLTVYGRVPAQPVTSPGTYSDTITVTLTF